MFGRGNLVGMARSSPGEKSRTSARATRSTKKPGSATLAARLRADEHDTPRCAYCFSAPPEAAAPEQLLPALRPEQVPQALRSARARGRRR